MRSYSESGQIIPQSFLLDPLLPGATCDVDLFTLHHQNHHNDLHHLHNLPPAQNFTCPTESIMMMKAAAAAPVIGENDVNVFCLQRSRNKKERHMKINTAHGRRDRRVRLSLSIASKFFNLQDMLQFNKASKTLEWLLVRAKPAIDELKMKLQGTGPASCSDGAPWSTPTSASDCEIFPSPGDGLKDASDHDSRSESLLTPVKSSRVRRIATQRVGHVVPRETRARARERARERTKQKMIIKSIFQHHLETLHEYSSNTNANFLYQSRSQNLPSKMTINPSSNCHNLTEPISNWSGEFSSHHEVRNDAGQIMTQEIRLWSDNVFPFTPAGLVAQPHGFPAGVDVEYVVDL